MSGERSVRRVKPAEAVFSNCLDRCGNLTYSTIRPANASIFAVLGIRPTWSRLAKIRAPDNRRSNSPRGREAGGAHNTPCFPVPGENKQCFCRGPQSGGEKPRESLGGEAREIQMIVVLSPRLKWYFRLAGRCSDTRKKWDSKRIEII